jgi:hypothetical protein
MATVPRDIFEVTSMLWTEEKRMLYYLAREDYTGSGGIVDMGSFLGGSTVCLAAGLRTRSLTGAEIHAYDLFRLGEWERATYFPDESSRTSVRDVFEENIARYRELVDVHEGDILTFPWNGSPIEILFVDIAKSYRVFDHLVQSYFPFLILGRSLVILQDYLSPQTGPWHHVVMEKLSSHFEYVADCTAASAIFLLRSQIPRQTLMESLWDAMDLQEKLTLMDRAIERLDTEEKRNFLRSNRKLLVDGRDMTWGMHYHRL